MQTGQNKRIRMNRMREDGIGCRRDNIKGIRMDGIREEASRIG